jgi:hypothetical protein
MGFGDLMDLLQRTAIFFVLLSALTSSALVAPGSGAKTLPQLGTSPSIPVQTDDRLDPINLIFTGYAPSWWVASNMAGWSDSAYCSGPKTVDGASYNYTLERPDPNGLPCLGPRDHIRIWGMGYNQVFGEWSVASVHHEHTVCDPICHHVIDSWNTIQAVASSAYINGSATALISEENLGNAGDYQGIYFNGNVTMIQLKPPSTQFPVVFNENGLGNQTTWAVTLNGTTAFSTGPTIVFEKTDGAYPFNASRPQGFNVSPSSGTIIVKTGATQTINYRTPWTSSVATFSPNGHSISIGFYGNATVAISAVQLSTTGSTTVSFTVAEIGGIGALNVTIPRSIAPSNASPVVYVNGTQDASTKLTSDSHNYYLYFLMLYGTHSIHLQLDSPRTPYLEYFTGAAIATLALSALVLVFRSRKRKRSESTSSIMLNNRFWTRCALFSP